MGKNTVSNRKKKLARKKKIISTKHKVQSLTIDELLLQAQEQIDTFQYEAAQVFCQEALKRDPDHVRAIVTSGNLCVEIKNFEGAKQCYGRAIFLQPEEGHAKYLVMAQLMEGIEATQYYLKGIELIKSSLNKIKNSFDNQELKSIDTTSPINTESKENKPIEKVEENLQNEMKDTNGDSNIVVPNFAPSSSLIIPNTKPVDATLKLEMSSAYCALSELYMTDLCDEEEAEKMCQKYSKLATESDPTNAEAFQQMANFLLVKEDFDEAREYMKKSVALWLPKYKSVDDGTAVQGSFDPVEVCNLSYETRLNCARQLIELEEHQLANDVLECLVGEDDEIIDSWYLFGWNNYLMGDEHYSSARESFNRALQEHKKLPSDDEQMIEHIKQLLKEIGDIEEECNVEIDENELEDIEAEINGDTMDTS